VEVARGRPKTAAPNRSRTPTGGSAAQEAASGSPARPARGRTAEQEGAATAGAPAPIPTAPPVLSRSRTASRFSATSAVSVALHTGSQSPLQNSSSCVLSCGAAHRAAADVSSARAPLLDYEKRANREFPFCFQLVRRSDYSMEDQPQCFFQHKPVGIDVSRHRSAHMLFIRWFIAIERHVHHWIGQCYC